jgi:hypothetical protein
MADNALAVATLVFACLAGVGGLVRIYQNFLMYRLHKKAHEDKRALRHCERDEDGL